VDAGQGGTKSTQKGKQKSRGKTLKVKPPLVLAGGSDQDISQGKDIHLLGQSSYNSARQGSQVITRKGEWPGGEERRVYLQQKKNSKQEKNGRKEEEVQPKGRIKGRLTNIA